MTVAEYDVLSYGRTIGKNLKSKPEILLQIDNMSNGMGMSSGRLQHIPEIRDDQS